MSTDRRYRDDHENVERGKHCQCPAIMADDIGQDDGQRCVERWKIYEAYDMIISQDGPVPFSDLHQKIELVRSQMPNFPRRWCEGKDCSRDQHTDNEEPK